MSDYLTIDVEDEDLSFLAPEEERVCNADDNRTELDWDATEAVLLRSDSNTPGPTSVTVREAIPPQEASIRPPDNTEDRSQNVSKPATKHQTRKRPAPPDVFPIAGPSPPQPRRPRCDAEREYRRKTVEGVVFFITEAELESIPFTEIRAAKRQRRTIFLRNNRRVRLKLAGKYGQDWIWYSYRDDGNNLEPNHQQN